MRFIKWITKITLGTKLDPFNPQVFRSIALIAFFAWIGLGSDGLSSSCYGPEEAYLELGPYTHLAMYVAIATAITIFVIAFGYNQVIELYPSGGGGYKVATQLLHPYAGLVSGAALMVDYMLTITISVVSSVSAVFSLLPQSTHYLQLYLEIIVVLLLLLLNLRGMKESILVLLPVFLGFVITHFIIILYGIFSHRYGVLSEFSQTLQETSRLQQVMGWGPILALLLHSYSLGAGTYTGLEAVSNNVHHLAEPRVRTGKWTMLYIAISLSFTAGGLMLLYLLWDVKFQAGSTLNAVLFHNILGDSTYGHLAILILLAFEAGLLFVAANTGFIAGPATLANMALDNWVPSRFRYLSSRLVMQNSLVFFGICAIVLLLWTRGQIRLLVILYSINVFITFTLSLLGLCVHWFSQRGKQAGWLTLLITSGVIVLCIFIKRHYNLINQKLRTLDEQIVPELKDKRVSHHKIEPRKPTAVIFVAKSLGMTLHTLIATLRLFPDHFTNFVFLSAGIVDIESFHGKDSLEKMRNEVESNLDYLVKFCQHHGYAAEKHAVYQTDIIIPLVALAEEISQKYSDCTFFASKLVLEKENWITRLLDNETSVMLQRRIFALGKQLIILPVKI